RSSRMVEWRNSATQRDHFDLLVGFGLVRRAGLKMFPTLIRKSITSSRPQRTNRRGQLRIAGPMPQERLDIETGFRKQASYQLSIRGQADPGATAAEGLRDGTNNPDFSQA